MEEHISIKLDEEIGIFLRCVKARRLSDNLHRVVIDYIRHECTQNGNELPEFIPYFLLDVGILFDFLGIVEKHANQPHA